jgi:ribosome-associated protein
MARSIVNILEEKKGEDILLIDIQEIAIFADYFVICTGTSDRMLDALAKAAVEGVKENHGYKGRIEGNASNGWVVVDFIDVVLHLFSPDQRDYYRLEELWEEGKVLVRLQ